MRSPYQIIGLDELMARTEGRRSLVVALIDGPVWARHPYLAQNALRWLPTRPRVDDGDSSHPAARAHGTFMAGMLVARRDSPSPGICPGCTLLVRPIFDDTGAAGVGEPATVDARTLADAMVECVDAGARVLNLSVAASDLTAQGEQRCAEALDYMLRHGALAVAAAGNQGMLVSSVITRHPGVVPVIATDERGMATAYSNIGRSAGLHGVSVPVEAIRGLIPDGVAPGRGGTSVVTPVVAGAAALLWSLFPDASATQIRSALVGEVRLRTSVVPPLLDARRAYTTLASPGASIAASMREGGMGDESDHEGFQPDTSAVATDGAHVGEPPHAGAREQVTLQHCGLPGCQVPGTHQHVAPPAALGYVYALGRLHVRFPSLGVEKEFAQAVGRDETTRLSDSAVAHRVLTDPTNLIATWPACCAGCWRSRALTPTF